MRYIDITKPETGRATTQSVRDNFAAIKEQLDGSLRHVYSGTYFVAPFARSAVYLVMPGLQPRSSDPDNWNRTISWTGFQPQMNLWIEGAGRYGTARRRMTGVAWALFVVNFQGMKSAWRGLWQPVGTSQLNNVSFELEEMGYGLYPHYVKYEADRQDGWNYWFSGGYWERTISDYRPLTVFSGIAD